MSDEPPFSQRIGVKPLKKETQISSMNNPLKTGLWNVLWTRYWNRFNFTFASINRSPSPEEEWKAEFEVKLWIDYFKGKIDELKRWSPDLMKIVKNYYFDAKWYEVYDLIEFTVRNFRVPESVKKSFIVDCNKVLEKESSGYRFVGETITPITSMAEITEVEKAIDSPLEVVNEHLNRALSLLSDRKTPDPRNSIKESISAVEAICQKITNKKSATLGDALNVIKDKKQIELPSSLRDAFNKIYGYTSSQEGIRHALAEAPTVNSDDARFMLVACSAFVNYLISKATKSGIELK